MEESLSTASLVEGGNDWQLAVDSLTSSMDSSVSLQPPSLPGLTTAPQSSAPSSNQRTTEEDQLTGQLSLSLSLSLSIERDTSSIYIYYVFVIGSISTEV